MSNAPRWTVVMLGAAVPCFGQSATVAVTHDDPDGFVSPGQTVVISTIIAWGGALAFWEIEGGVAATPNVGIASNNQFPYTVQPGPNLIINPGTPSLGSVDGVQIRYGDLSFYLFGTPPHFPFGSSPFTVVSFQWTAPTAPGVVEFAWTPAATLPQPLLFFGGGWQPVLTTYLGTSLSVVPAPHAALVLLAGVCTITAARRRR